MLHSSLAIYLFFFFSSRRRHTRCSRDWSSDVCSSDLLVDAHEPQEPAGHGADEAREDEERDPGRGRVTEPARQEHGGPEADGSDDEVDPEARVGAAAAEALPDEDRGARRAEGADEREGVHGAWHESSRTPRSWARVNILAFRAS